MALQDRFVVATGGHGKVFVVDAWSMTLHSELSLEQGICLLGCSVKFLTVLDTTGWLHFWSLPDLRGFMLANEAKPTTISPETLSHKFRLHGKEEAPVCMACNDEIVV
jgi:hypothetical protein